MARVATYEQKRNPPQNDSGPEEEVSSQKRPQLDMSHPVMDIDCSFDQTYVLFGNEDNGTAVVKGIDHTLQARVSPEEADTIENYSFKNIFYQRVKNHCKLFSCFVFVKTFIFVSHGRFLSLFNVLKQKWIDHMEFKSEIVQVFRSEDGQGGFDICVLQDDANIALLRRS